MTYTAPNVPTATESQALARLRWRCRRGMRELDVVFQRYLDDDYAHAPEAERRAFEALLEQQDPQLLAYLMGRELPSDPDQVHVVAKLSHARS